MPKFKFVHNLLLQDSYAQQVQVIMILQKRPFRPLSNEKSYFFTKKYFRFSNLGRFSLDGFLRIVFDISAFLKHKMKRPRWLAPPKPSY